MEGHRERRQYPPAQLWDVSQREVWLTVTHDLPPLLAVIESELSRLA
jgi:hypothetical protein